MKIVFIGFGSIARQHAEILLNGYDHELIAFRSQHNGRPNPFGLDEVYSWEELFAFHPEIAFITNPTNLHIETAIQCANMGMHLFIEKPLSNSLDGIDKLVQICRERKLTCYTAYCLRFHPVIQKIREIIADKDIYHARVVCSSYLPDWRPNQDYKQGYSVLSERGGGVLLDLSHEFDYINYLFGPIEDMYGLYGRLTDITIDAEDFADVIIETAKDINVNLHLDYFSHHNERTIKIDFEGGYLIGDLINNRIQYSYNRKEEIIDLKGDKKDYLKAQIDYYFNSLGSNSIMNNMTEAS
ncbi:MAG: Gfo/Idh/MocA family oxidoreductase, partial [Candidatus Margulisiibacteriota bacterium]